MKLTIQPILLLFPFLAFGQNQTYLGFEIGPKFEIYQYADNGDGLYTKPFLYSPVMGLTIGQELNETVVLETGFFVNDYGESFRIRGEGFGYSASNAILAYQIPIRLKARFHFLTERLNILTTVGYTLAINNDYGATGEGGSFVTSFGPQYNDSTRTEYISTYSLKKIYGLLETGIALDYEWKNSMKIFLAANYLIGFNRLVEMDVSYWINNEPEQSGTVFSNGDYFSVTLGIKYPISRFWTSKPDK